MLGLLLGVVIRWIIAAVVIVVFTALWLLSGIPSGGGSRELAYLAAGVLFLGVGWIFLPIFRASPITAALLVRCWIALGVSAYLFGNFTVRGWMFKPWLVATVVLAVIVCLPSRDRKSDDRKVGDEV